MYTQRRHRTSYPQVGRQSSSLVLTDEKRAEVIGEIQIAINQRPEPVFAVGDVIESLYGIREITRMYFNGIVNGWRYETKLLTDGTRDNVYTRDWRTFREDQLVEWNPCGAYQELFIVPPIITVVTVQAPMNTQKLLTGNTMVTPLLPAQVYDLRCVARDVLEWLRCG